MALASFCSGLKSPISKSFTKILIQGEKMRYLQTTTMMMMLLLMGCSSAEPTPKGLSTKVSNQTAMRKEALIVGVSDYKGTKYDLGGVQKDVLRMEKLFKSWGFHITVLQDAESMRLEQSLSSYSALDKNSNFIFYYSGHGYHVKDENGDEKLDNPNDDQDEALVLSDGTTNKLFLDDALFGYLNAIKAKKMVMLDSCHSGTAFKAFGDKNKPKSMGANIKIDVMKTKSFRPQESKINSGDYIVFSASQDIEESLDTPYGGLFTTSFSKQFENKNSKDVKLMNLKQKIEQEIVNYCNKIDKPVYHPNLSTSKIALKYTTINEFFNLKNVPTPTVTNDIKVTGSPRFNEGDLLDFQIDTLGNRGYLTVVSIEEHQPFVMYQSSQAQKGVFNFKDFTINPKIECYKACKGCASEQSVVYVLFSAKPIKVRINPNSKAIESEPNGQFKSFRKKEEASFKTLVKKFETTIY